MILPIKISNEGKFRRWQKEYPYIQGIAAICQIALCEHFFCYGKKAKVNDDWIKISIYKRKKSNLESSIKAGLLSWTPYSDLKTLCIYWYRNKIRNTPQNINRHSSFRYQKMRPGAWTSPP